MFKFLLATRYLRTRYIALASILSVTLGVATMIVVNSVMAGFREEMYKRLHGILSDVVIESHSLEGIDNPAEITQQVRDLLGDELEGLTTTVHIPAIMSFNYGEHQITRQVNLIGIDDESYASVSDFSKFLLHPRNQEQLDFALREDGYDGRLQKSGWRYRRWKAEADRVYQEHLRASEAIESRQSSHPQVGPNPEIALTTHTDSTNQSTNDSHDEESLCPHCGKVIDGESMGNDDLASDSESELTPDAFVDPTLGLDPANEKTFDPAVDQHPGIVLGIAISQVKYRNESGKVEEHFYCQPGDDVTVTFASAGRPPQAVSSLFTVVDFYESKMSEYDATFAFCPLSRLQELRGMQNLAAGTSAVTSIQLRLRPHADLASARDRLRAAFPLAAYHFRIETWKDMQGPLLAAVQWETAILNILLFLIIGVAGFGIFATFFMIVVEKTKDIGILKSLGAPSSGVLSIFLSYGFALGTVGAGVGMVLGVLFVHNINGVARLIEQLTGQEVFDPTVYYFQEIPTILSPLTITWIVLGAMFIAVLASVMPAVRAARMHPVEALRYE